jgi:16S rRNA (adenine1518-N6/adenine1519-N6)-dimethyltransferase
VTDTPRPPRQTLSYLRNLFERHGIAPQHRYGQNFLIDLNIHELIARAAELTPSDVVLEVGPGAGALTSLMAPQAAAVVAVEIDPAMAALTREAVADFDNATVLHVDALAGKHRIEPAVVDALRERLAAAPGRRLKMVANLPFNVATPLITNLLVDDELRPSMFVVTIQREVADRMLAAPTASHYGALSILVQALCDVELVRVLAPSVFWPRPKVDSAVVKLVTRPEKRAAIPDLPWFHHVVRQVFLHRRKNLRGALAAIGDRSWTKAQADAVLAAQDLDGTLRAEALNVEEWIALAEALRPHLAGTSTAEDDSAP